MGSSAERCERDRESLSILSYGWRSGLFGWLIDLAAEGFGEVLEFFDLLWHVGRSRVDFRRRLIHRVGLRSVLVVVGLHCHTSTSYVPRRRRNPVDPLAAPRPHDQPAAHEFVDWRGSFERHREEPAPHVIVELLDDPSTTDGVGLA